MAAVKRLPVHHHRADYIFISCGIIWAHSGYFENPVLHKPVPAGANTASQTTLLHMNKIESPIFVLLCVLCFGIQPFRLLFVHHENMPI